MCRKRHRTTFSQQQLSILEEAFKQNIYPSGSLRDTIALQTNLDSLRVQVWFQNRRAKHKRQVSQVIRDFTSAHSYTTTICSNSVVVPVVRAAALEAALSGDDFCIADQIIAESCANDLSNCYEDTYEPASPFAHQQHNLSAIQNNNNHHHHHHHHHHQQQQQQQASDQPHQQQLEAQPQQQHQEQQRQHSHDGCQNQYYNYYRQQIGSLKSTMTEFLQS